MPHPAKRLGFFILAGGVATNLGEVSERYRPLRHWSLLENFPIILDFYTGPGFLQRRGRKREKFQLNETNHRDPQRKHAPVFVECMRVGVR